MFGTSDAFTSISLDAVVAAAAFLLWAFHDMVRLQFSLLSFLALCAAFAVALALPIPLYLAARTVRQAHVSQCPQPEPSSTILLQPGRAVCCPLLVFFVAAAGSQVAFITNVENLRQTGG